MAPAYSPEEMRRYWRQHSRLWSDLDRDEDPEGLTNVCYNGAPLWLNRFAARCQRKTFLGLLASVGSLDGLPALDIGCGTGRWSRLLAERGARVTGIDLQCETLADNRRRHPACTFLEMSADAIGLKSASFHLASAVTVLQHIPYEPQMRALAEMRRVLVKGGSALILEGIRDRGPAVFSNTREEWFAKSRSCGFEVAREIAYDFAPLLYAMRGAASAARGDGDSALPSLEEYLERFRRSARATSFPRRVYRGLLHGATLVSYPLEDALRALAPISWGHHLGILLRAV